MTAAAFEPTHPVATVVASVRRELRSVAQTPVWSMSASETGDALVEVTRLEAQVAEVSDLLCKRLAVTLALVA